MGSLDFQLSEKRLDFRNWEKIFEKFTNQLVMILKIENLVFGYNILKKNV